MSSLRKVECTFEILHELAGLGLRRVDIDMITDWNKDIDNLKEALLNPETSYQVYYQKFEWLIVIQMIQHKFKLNPDKELPLIIQKACEEDKLKLFWFIGIFSVVPEYWTKEIIEKGIKISEEVGVKKTHQLKIALEARRIVGLSKVNGDQYLIEAKSMIEELLKEEDICRTYLIGAYQLLLDHQSYITDYTKYADICEKIIFWSLSSSALTMEGVGVYLKFINTDFKKDNGKDVSSKYFRPSFKFSYFVIIHFIS